MVPRTVLLGVLKLCFPNIRHHRAANAKNYLTSTCTSVFFNKTLNVCFKNTFSYVTLNGKSASLGIIEDNWKNTYNEITVLRISG